MTLRVSATMLESFRLFMQPDQEWMTEADLLATIRGETVQNAKMRLGTAFGKVIEDPQRYAIFDDRDSEDTADESCYEADGIAFDRNVIEPMLALVDRRGAFELKATTELGDTTLVAKPDHVYGADITEIKTTLGQFSTEKYLDSMQWRVDALVFQPTSIVYQVACLSEDRDGVIGLKGIETLRVFPYPNLRADVAALLARFVEFVTARGLDGFLRERQRTAA